MAWFLLLPHRRPRPAFFRRRGTLPAVAGGLLTLFLAGGAWAVELLPHRALYTMVLGRVEAVSDVIDARGTMLYSFAATCDGWTAESRTILRIQYANGEEAETTWTFAAWESRDGLSYTYHLRHNRDGELVERLKGRATLEDGGGTGVASFSSPQGLTVELPKGTMFPTAHLLAVIAAADAGENRMGRVVFDGSSLDNPYEISALISSITDADRGAMAAALGLDEESAWNIRMAFFPHKSRAALPNYEVEIRYRADGVADRLTQDFGDFALDLEATDIEILDKPNC